MYYEAPVEIPDQDYGCCKGRLEISLPFFILLLSPFGKSPIVFYGLRRRKERIMERQTIKQVQAEAERRADEDSTGRVVYMTEGGRLGICLLDDFSERPVLDLGVFIVWPGNQVEIL